MDRIIRQNDITNRLNLLWIGLGLYVLAFSQTDIVMLGFVGNIFNHLVPVGLLLIFFSLFTTIRPAQIQRTRLAWVLISLITVWHIFMAFRLDPEDMLVWINYSDPYGYLVYLFVLILLIPPIPLVQSYFTIGKWIVIAGMPIMFIPLFFYASSTAMQFGFEGYLCASALILMTNKYHKSQWLWIVFVGLFIAFLVATIKARRNIMMTSMLYMLGAAYMIIFKGKKIARSTQILLLMTGISIAIIGAALFVLGSKGIFSQISERAGENTREYVFLLFFWDMLQTPIDMIVGRGIRGGYECQGVDENSSGIRYAVENGYLQMMLKGGIIYITIILTTLLTAIKKAWSSKNQLCQASIIIISIQIFDMIPFGLHGANIKTFIIWMCVSICLCPTLCKMNDEELIDVLTEKKHKLPKWE